MHFMKINLFGRGTLTTTNNKQNSIIFSVNKQHVQKFADF